MPRVYAHGIAALLVACGLALSPACGDDDGPGEPGEDAGAEQDETCSQPGQTQTGCSCEEPRSSGSRECTEEGLWSACVCPPVRRDDIPCREGERIVCEPCPGESEWRRGTCGEEGTAICPSCDLFPGQDAGAARADAAAESDAG